VIEVVITMMGPAARPFQRGQLRRGLIRSMHIHLEHMRSFGASIPSQSGRATHRTQMLHLPRCRIRTGRQSLRHAAGAGSFPLYRGWSNIALKAPHTQRCGCATELPIHHVQSFVHELKLLQRCLKVSQYRTVPWQNRNSSSLPLTSSRR
jgi:hypothetical protein